MIFFTLPSLDIWFGKQFHGEESRSCWTHQEETFGNTKWPQLMVCYVLGEESLFFHFSIFIFLSTQLFSRCSLGDITENDACFEKALEVSNNRSYTAKVCLCIFVFFCLPHICFYHIIKLVFLLQRSMAKSAYKRGDYYTSIILWCVFNFLSSLPLS